MAALGFEPASDILIVDDALNDDLSISSDDIRVSTKESVPEAKKASPAPSAKTTSGPPSQKSNKTSNKTKKKAKTQPGADAPAAKKSSLVDRLNAESKSADALKSRAKSAAAKTGEKLAEAKTLPTKIKADQSPPDMSKPDAAKSSTSGSPARTKAKPAQSDLGKTGSNKGEEPGFSVAPPPPVAANAVLLSEPSPATYGFSDVQLPSFKGAFSRFKSGNGSSSEASVGEVQAKVVENAETLTAEVASAAPAATPTKTGPAKAAKAKPSTSPSESVIDARVAESPPMVPNAPATDGPATSPPALAPDPEIRIIEDPAEPNVYRAPTRSGRTRIRSRKVRRQIRHIDPWSVLTFSVIFHACVFGALLLASVLVWRFADGAGLIENAEDFWAELADKPDFEIDQGVLVRSAAMIAGLLAIASSVMMVLLTVFFNLISDIVGGIRVTVIEEEPVRITK